MNRQEWMTLLAETSGPTVPAFGGCASEARLPAPAAPAPPEPVEPIEEQDRVPLEKPLPVE